MARRKKNRAGAIGEKKIRGRVHTLGLPSLNAKSLGVRLFLDFANEFGTLQTTLNAKFIYKVLRDAYQGHQKEIKNYINPNFCWPEYR